MDVKTTENIELISLDGSNNDYTSSVAGNIICHSASSWSKLVNEDGGDDISCCSTVADDFHHFTAPSGVGKVRRCLRGGLLKKEENLDELEVICCSDGEEDESEIMLDASMRRYIENRNVAMNTLSSARNPLCDLTATRRRFHRSTSDIDVARDSWKSSVNKSIHICPSRHSSSILEMCGKRELHRDWSSTINDIHSVCEGRRKKWYSLFNKFQIYFPMKNEWKSNLNCIEKNNKNEKWKFK